jgi:salicylate hydroxylase
MIPHQGQGCNQAIEDAEGFRLFAGETVSRDQVQAMLRDLDRVRRPRGSQIQNDKVDSAMAWSLREALLALLDYSVCR